MAIHDVTYLGKREVAEGTMEFRMSRPEGFSYRAGQFCDIILDAAPGTDKMSHVHGFSFVSAPYEDHLAVATRMRSSPFKEAMRALDDGAAIKLDANFGDFILHKTETMPAVFLAGGIGVTPVHSMVAQATHDGTAHQLTLFYANRTEALAAYTDDFKRLVRENTNFHFVPVYTRESGKDVAAEHGYLTAEMIRRHVPDLAAPRWYVSGPEGFVKAARAMLVEMGANEDNLRTEEFEGY